MIHYDPFSCELQEDPYPTYERLRKLAPAYYNAEQDFWALSRYDDVREALKDSDTFCSSRGSLLEDTSELTLPMVVGMSPPNHTRVRSVLSRALTPQRLAGLERPVRKLTRQRLARVAATGTAEIIGDLATVIPMAAISEMLSVPEADRETLRQWADDMVSRDNQVKGIPERSLAATENIGAYFTELVGDRRNGGGDLLGMLLAAEQADEISHEEILGFCWLLIIAGNETTRNLIGNTVYQLSIHRDQRERLLADPSLVPQAIEEVLRYESPTQIMARTLTKDVVIHGQMMTKGQRVAMILASANRDEDTWQNADVFQIDRDASGHLAFGIDIHHCLGASLARMEAGVVLEELLRWMPDFAVDYDGIVRIRSASVRGMSRLPLEFTPRSEPLLSRTN